MSVLAIATLLSLAADAGPPAVDVSRFCVETDGTVVVENDCGCNDALRCSTELSGRTVTVRVSTDPARMPQCDDCFPMVKGRCALPGKAEGKLEVKAGSLQLTVELVRGKPRSEVCVAQKK